MSDAAGTISVADRTCLMVVAENVCAERVTKDIITVTSTVCRIYMTKVGVCVAAAGNGTTAIGHATEIRNVTSKIAVSTAAA